MAKNLDPDRVIRLWMWILITGSGKMIRTGPSPDLQLWKTPSRPQMVLIIFGSNKEKDVKRSRFFVTCKNFSFYSMIQIRKDFNFLDLAAVQTFTAFVI
jgi:hypothetical protein